MHAEKNVPSRVWAKALKKCKTKGNHHGIDPLYWVMIRLIDPVQEYHRKKCSFGLMVLFWLMVLKKGLMVLKKDKPI